MQFFVVPISDFMAGETLINPLMRKKSSDCDMKERTVSEQFKVLRAVDSSVLEGAKPLQMPKDIPNFPNAQGGFRMVTYDEVRTIARDSALRTMKALQDVQRSGTEVQPSIQRQ